MQCVSLADMHAAAVRVADTADATLAKEQAVLTAEIDFARANKQACSGSYWHAAHVAGLKARAARAVADALAEVCAEL
ncbi:hypothetical protein [Mesorhizobium sp. B2-1-2]|uniref:hypothetical protein n=1 Tax=Mesorhizobium sp. B2-1-2 TaxID=2589973 RepID=UPI001126AC2B|nr:hypothetical protein [Mesorhizobium sp. B2-1-2]TPN11702.1 hypothetical protein FJ971_09850 [Mesorhizobium sp. B2-1-2]